MYVLVRMRNSQARRFVPSVKLLEAPVAAQVRLLHQVLGVGLVARHAQRGRVELGRVLHRLLGERAPVGHDAGPYWRPRPRPADPPLNLCQLDRLTF